MTTLIYSTDATGKLSGAPPSSSFKYFVLLNSTQHATLTIPVSFQRWEAQFSYKPGVETWVAVNQTAAAPSTSSFTSTTSEMNPTKLMVESGDIIDVYSSSDSAAISIVLYVLT
jgi:hypothetical protein